ncbi:MAG: hypothetical protein IT374_01680 [Polyangiaceae bacterium]|nr:hypothetical protein [Polyangiaceae bacterium]
MRASSDAARARHTLALLAALVAVPAAQACGSGGTSFDGDAAAAGSGAAVSSGGTSAAGAQAAGAAQGGGVGGAQGGTAQGGEGGDPFSGGGASGAAAQGGASAGAGGAVKPLCGAVATTCGATELCDEAHLGLDDDCDGVVDEGCPCTPGTSHWCFKGDPALRGTGTCRDGFMRCQEVGEWNACSGGKQGLGPDACVGGAGVCKDLEAVPFATVQLSKGTAGYTTNADPGSEKYEVKCPAGVQTCPAVSSPGSNAASFQPLQSGEYEVSYTKSVGGVAETCNYKVYVAGEGLRVELAWDNVGVEGSTPTSAKGPDLDLHVHRPGALTPWVFTGGGDDCYFGNCTIDSYDDQTGPGDPAPGPSWFSDTASPRNWTLYPDPAKNSCYFAPRGTGDAWKAQKKGCHNPRLDLDNHSCDAAQTDPSHPSFCAPENVNFDELPDGAWIRVAVHYFGECTKTLPTHPSLTLHCNGAPIAQLGSVREGGQLKPSGYDNVVTFQPSDCQKAVWIAADVYVKRATCGYTCTAVPIYGDKAKKTPLVTTKDVASMTLGPPYPPTP